MKKSLPSLTCILLFGLALSAFLHIIAFVHFQLVRSDLKKQLEEINYIDKLQNARFNIEQQGNKALHDQYATHIESIEQRLDTAEHKLEVVEFTVDADAKLKPRIVKTVAAIKNTLPAGGNILAGCPKQPSPGELWTIASAIISFADEYSVSASLIAGIIRQESNFCQQAKSKVGAIGYMQIMPDTANDIATDLAMKKGRKLRYWIGRDNIEMGTAYISEQLMTFNGDMKLAVGAYNGGPTHIKKVLAGITKEFHAETADYMVRVLAFQREYEALGVN